MIMKKYKYNPFEVDKIEFDALTKRAQLGFSIAWELANRDARIIVDKDGK